MQRMAIEQLNSFLIYDSVNMRVENMLEGMVSILAVLAIILFCLVCFLCLFWSKIFHSDDKTEVNNPEKLSRSAKIVNISRRKVGLKGDYKIETCVTFDDGFTFTAYDTETSNHVGYYTISVTENMTNEIITRAIQEHESACGAAGLAKPFICGKCGRKGPYEGNCPECGSSLKRFLN